MKVEVVKTPTVIKKWKLIATMVDEKYPTRDHAIKKRTKGRHYTVNGKT